MKTLMTSQSRVLTPGILLGAVISATIVLTASADPTNCAPPPSSLVSWWRGEGTALDSAGTNNGVLLNGAGFGGGEVGQAFSFNSNNQCVNIPYSRTLVASNYSVEAWVKPLTQVSDSISQDLIVGQAYGWQLVARPGTSGVKIAFQFATSLVTFYDVVSASQVPIGQFCHLVGTWDGTTLRLYVNGVLDAQRVPGATPVDLGYGFYIGGFYIQSGGSVSYSGQYFNGLIDEASYYGRALSGAEIQALYGAASAGKCLTPVPPSIQAQPQSQAVVLGANASLSVVAGGTSPLSYQWHFNGAHIASATGSVLTLTNVQFANAGTYDVAVTNLYGSTNSAGATLTVLRPPQITDQPQDQTVAVGSNATFSVTATGSGPLSYQWYFNGTALGGATNTSLALSGVSLSQAGSYRVSVSNLVGSVSSRSAILVVLGNGSCAPPPAGLVSWWAGDGTALDLAGTNKGVLVNGAGFGAGEVGQAFSFNGSNQCVNVPYSRTLVASNYSVEAWINPRTQVSDSISQDLIVGQAYGWHLVARTGSSGVSIAFGFGTSLVTFYDVVSASQVPIGQFSHLVGTWDGTTLRLYVNGVLNAQRVPGATPVDSGYSFYIGGFYIQSGAGVSYSGQYFNGLIDEASYYGRALSVADIQALYNAGSAGKCKPAPPSILMPPQSQTVQCSSNASFSVTAAGQPPLSYQWYFSSTLIPGATNALLALSTVGFAQAGEYSVVVTNAYGSAIGGPAVLTVVDTIPPTITSCASNHILAANADCTATLADLTGEVVAWDACGPVTVSQTPPPQTAMPIGTNAVLLTVSDAASNKATCAAVVIVLDRTPPVLVCAPNKQVECGATWNFDDPSAADNCGAASVTVLSTVTNALCGSTLTATRTWQATDASSNLATCSQTVTVKDTTPPSLSCPGGKVLEFQDERGTVATYSVTATDVCSAVSLVATPPSGSVFPIGVTPVHVQATDSCSNSAQCSFTVTVLGAQGVKSNVLTELVALRAGVNPVQPFAQKFDDAIQHLANSLNPAYWIDQTHLQPKGGNTAMNQEKLAVNKLEDIMGSKKCPVDPAVLQGFIDRIVKCDRLLAIISVKDAANAGLNARRIAEALAMVAKGDHEAAAGHYANAIEHYRNAWRHALQLRLQVSLNPDGSTRLQFVGNNSKSYRIEVSTDMVKWVSLGACTADAEGNVVFTDPNAANQPLRFYRAVEQ